MKRTVSVVHLLLIILLWGCDMPLSDDYYRDIANNENAQFKLYVNLPKVNGKLTVKDRSNAQFFILCNDLEIQEIRVTVDNNESQYNTNHGFIYLDDRNLKEGDNNVKFSFIAKSNNESLANQLAGEYYYGEANVTINKDSKAIMPQVIEESVSERGDLKLTWESHIPDDVELIQYRLHYINNENSDQYETNIPITSNSYNDGGYIGEDATYTLYAIIKNSITEELIYWEVGQCNVANKLNAYQVVSSDRQKLTVGWNNPYNASVDVTVNNELHSFTSATQKIDIPLDDLRDKSWDDKFNIKIQYKRGNKVQYSLSFDTYSYGTKVADYAAYHEVSHDGRYLYTIANGYLTNYDLVNNRLVSERDIVGYHSRVECSSPISEMFAVSNKGFNSSQKAFITIYKDASLTEETIIEDVDSPFPIFLTTDNKLVYFNYGNNELIGTVCNAVTGKKEKTFTLANRYAIYQILLSADGRKLYYNLGFNIICVELSNYNVIDSSNIVTPSYSNQIFESTNNSNELGIIDYYNKVYFVETKTGEETRGIDFPSNFIHLKVDKYTGNFIGYKANTISIYSHDNGTELFSTGFINHEPLLMNNTLTSIEGIFLNLKAYL